MATYNFVERTRPKNGNTPQTYDVTENGRPAGTLTKSRSGWQLSWLGTNAKFPSKLSVRRHLAMLGHRTNGLD